MKTTNTMQSKVQIIKFLFNDSAKLPFSFNQAGGVPIEFVENLRDMTLVERFF